MKSNQLLLALISIALILSCETKEIASRIEIVPITIDQEVASIWKTINDIAFFETQGYTINLPKDAEIDLLIVKSKKGEFGNDDFATIIQLLETKFFNQKDYKKAIEKVNEQQNLISSLVHQIFSEKENWDWEFNTFEKYKIIFTLYGTGGSYDPDQGTITLLTNREGDFMNYKNPANTIIHEITHMGMEYSIVQKYKLSHGNKERLVDTFVSLMFGEQLPAYKIQNMGDAKIDDYLTKKEDFIQLNSIVPKFAD
ncbi:MAG: hypothetical protein ACJAWV_001116 [Flammeovirgaceae bacterium]|jgi:hypothetical protein